MTMLGGFNQEELLALIEDALPDDHAAALRSRLEAFPGALELVLQMRADRESLRAAPMPQPAEDLLTELEPIIARAMLLGEAGGASTAAAHHRALSLNPSAFRDRHRRRRRTIHGPVRFLVAAGLLLGVGLTVWLVMRDQSPKGATGQSTSIAHSDQVSPTSSGAAPAVTQDARGATAEARPGAPQHPVVHHYDAVDPVSTTVAAHGVEERDRPSGSMVAERLTLASGDAAVEAGFALDLRGRRSGPMLARLASLVEFAQTGSLVRNFTLEELSALTTMRMVSDDERRAIEFVARGAVDRRARPPISAPQRESFNRVARRPEVTLGERLAGELAFDPPAVQQFTWRHEVGASHAVAVDADHLAPILERLHDEFGFDLSLRPLSGAQNNGGASDAGPASPNDMWSRWQRWRAAVDSLATLREGDERLMIVLPVFVE